VQIEKAARPKDAQPQLFFYHGLTLVIVGQSRRRDIEYDIRGHDMKKWLALTALLLPLALAGCSHPHPVYDEPPPPPDYAEVARQGFHDGFAAARRDVDEGKRPDVERHPRFRNPPVPPAAFDDYRRGFRRGYETFLHRG